MSDLLVLDASVAAKWYLNDEDHVQEADRYLQEFLGGRVTFHAPVLLQYELGHLLTKAQRNNMRAISREHVLEVYATFYELPIKFHDLNYKLRKIALDFSCRYQRTFYDSAYICLAMELGGRWLTAERTFGDTLPRGFPVKHIVTLESRS